MDQEKNNLSSDALLEEIFHYMELLFQEKELSSTLLLLTDLGRTLVHSDRASFWFRDKRTKQLWTLAALGIDKITIPENAGIVGSSIQNNEVIIINDPYHDDRFNSDVDKSTGYRTKSILTMPVTNSEGMVIGAYQAINKKNPDDSDGSFSETDTHRLAMAAAFCGRTLESYLLYNEALEDQLTGLNNRRGLYLHYSQHITPILDSKVASIVMCDIDHFKRVNDTWGHNAGDAILKHVAFTLQSLAGVNDGVFRWGGEEFIFLLPGKDLLEATDFAENCRKTIEKSVCHFESLELQVTMSFGAGELSNAKSVEENIKDVDAKLYYAKEHGRNCVIYSLTQ